MVPKIGGRMLTQHTFTQVLAQSQGISFWEDFRKGQKLRVQEEGERNLGSLGLYPPHLYKYFIRLFTRPRTVGMGYRF